MRKGPRVLSPVSVVFDIANSLFSKSTASNAALLKCRRQYTRFAVASLIILAVREKASFYDIAMPQNKRCDYGIGPSCG